MEGIINKMLKYDYLATQRFKRFNGQFIYCQIHILLTGGKIIDTKNLWRLYSAQYTLYTDYYRQNIIILYGNRLCVLLRLTINNE